ncbi:uncharacterized protein LODBEIA_P56470 [Lodderomyces beijingensis]|uniref:Anaphase-promoting complex subunit 4 WD40 domain-containing protein n=1 Tax=Lodderomyces beijingensis TaxID=1775926 RepID=A0ABP0ZTG5_9ASCO
MYTDFIELTTPKKLDIISDLKFSATAQDQLLVSSWCNRLLLYKCKSLENYPHEEPSTSPICIIDTAETPLCLLYPDIGGPIVGSLDGSVQELDFENMKLGRDFARGSHHSNSGDGYTGGGEEEEEEDNHLAGISNLCRGSNHSILASTFGRKLLVLDQRQQRPISTFQKTHKILTMDTTDKYLILGLSGQLIEIYDLQNLNTPLETRDIGLRYQFKDLKAFPNQQGFAVATIDARVSIESLDPSPQAQQEKKFTFKSHRHFNKTSGLDLVYPINSILFDKSPKQMLYTGGSDGYVCLWDIEKRKRIKQFARFETRDRMGGIESVAKLAMSYNDDLLAVATSDDSIVRRRSLSEAIDTRHPSRVYVRQLKDTGDNQNGEDDDDGFARVS